MMQTGNARQLYAYMRDILQPFHQGIGVMLIVAVLWAISLSLHPYILKVIINSVSEGSPQTIFYDSWLPITLYLVVQFTMTTAFRLYDYYVSIKMIPRLRANAANQALSVLADKSHRYYQENLSGNLANKVHDLTESVPELLQIIISRFFSHGLALALAVVTLWQVGLHFAVFIMVWSSFFIISALVFSRRLSMLAANWSEYTSIITGKIVDVLSNILLVRLFSAKSEEKRSLAETCQDATKAEQRLEWGYFWMWLGYGYSFFMLQILNFYVLCKGRQEGWVTVGDFALVLTVNLSVIDHLWGLAQEFAGFSRMCGRIVQALRALSVPADVLDSPKAQTLPRCRGQINFVDVSFSYVTPFLKTTQANSQAAVLLFENLSVMIGRGQKVGLVGYSGSGKSTFVNLILRFYDVTSGQVLIDGHDIRNVTQDSLRANIAMIPQEPSLFHRSLMENIRYGRLDATDAEVIEAAKRARAHDFITKMPQGYDSLAGERGMTLSGGQRQRIAIARAMLKNAPILILDEATSQLDSLTEGEMQDSLDELMQGKTTIVIAHRLSTLMHMDRILVFNQGKIVQDGSHAALLQQDGLYKDLWSAQVGGLLPGAPSAETRRSEGAFAH